MRSGLHESVIGPKRRNREKDVAVIRNGLPAWESCRNETKFNPALFARLAAGDGLALIQRCRALR